ncbi:patched domain-containing protein 3-like [Centruroides sculpturatus]|uniref:patched domain-containing protein 3-like n=1 Tax=Centruroides sculpturatus TaxID=218467 RepID=UPI000C6D3437|nr:patched domain-containing protein 3-like [Centruroides sculpturatus]
MKKTFIGDGLTSYFEEFGKVIARHPFYFLIPTILISALLSLGLKNIYYIEDGQYLLNSDSGKVIYDKQFVNKMFPVNTSEFYDVLRMTQLPKSPMVYISSKDERNMISKAILMEIQNLDQIIRNITVRVDGKLVSYNELCGIVNGKCFENPLSTIMTQIDDIFSSKKRIKFPIEIDPVNYSYQMWVLNLGGVKTDIDGYVKAVEYMRLMYPVDESNEKKDNWITEWRKMFLKQVREYKFNFIELYPCPLLSTELEFKILAEKITPMISVSVVIVTIFCILTYMTNSWIRSKPWMGVAAVASAGLAVVSSFGLMGACGVGSIRSHICLPFLILATEIDDAFVIVACWRITNIRNNVEERMGKTYANAAVSISITSLTNLLSFCIGMTAEFPGVRIFCYYAATCIGFTYLYQITFFGACLALSGYREESGLNPFTFRSSKVSLRKCQEEEKHESIFMEFFRDKVAELLSLSPIMTVTIILCIVNLTIGAWGVSSLKEGIDIFSLYPEHSLITKGYKILYGHFTEFSFPLNIIVNKTLDYSKPEVQQAVDNLLNKFHTHPNIAGTELEVSWLKYYKDFQKHPVSKFSLGGYNLTQKQDFIDGLRNVFLKLSAAKQFSRDVVFNENYTEIICSRFFLSTKNVANVDTERKVISDMWNIAEESEFPIVVYSFISHTIEQGIIIKRITFQLFWLTALLIFIIFTAFIPNFMCAFVVGFSIVTTIAETIGFMSLWGVNLDVFSMIVVILCNGFCVNYPTHVCYAFLSSSDPSAKGKLKDSLYQVGFPIFQGSVTTILGLLVFLYNNMYAYSSFVKIVTIISFVTVFHAMFAIPTFLVLILSYFEKRKTDQSDKNKYGEIRINHE